MLVAYLMKHIDVMACCLCICRHGSSSPVPPQESLPLLAEPGQLKEEDKRSLVLDFSCSACCASSLVGGKGCQLALLTQLKHTVS